MNIASSSILVEDIMNPFVVPLQIGIRIGKDLAMQLFSTLGRGWPVVDEELRVVGVTTQIDVLKALTEGLNLQKMKPEHIINRSFITVRREDSLSDVLQAMIEHKLSRIPVVNKLRLVGMVSHTDLLQHLLAPGHPKACALEWCYRCEQVKNVNVGDVSAEDWCELPYFLLTHQVDFSDVSIVPTYCPHCLPLLNRALNEHGCSRSHAESHVRKQRILIVDDERAITRFVEEALGVIGFEVVTSHNGREGLEVLEHSTVDGVLLDVDTPIMDGRTMLDELRWKGHGMPVIVLSGGSDEPTLRSFLQEGAQDFLVKPLSLKSLEKICKRNFKNIHVSSQSTRTLSLVN